MREEQRTNTGRRSARGRWKAEKQRQRGRQGAVPTKPPRRPRRPAEDLADPHRLARLVRDHWGKDAEERLTLRHWGRGWWHYESGRYRLVNDKDLLSLVTDQVKREFDTRPVTTKGGQNQLPPPEGAV